MLVVTAMVMVMVTAMEMEMATATAMAMEMEMEMEMEMANPLVNPSDGRWCRPTPLENLRFVRLWLQGK
jgi:hypothetical protein